VLIGKGIKIFLEKLKFVKNYQRFLSKIGRFSPVLCIAPDRKASELASGVNSKWCVLRGFEILHPWGASFVQNDKVCGISTVGQHEHRTVSQRHEVPEW